MQEPKRVSPEEAHRLMGEGYRYLDVRTREEFAEGHPQGAVNIPWANKVGGMMQPNPMFLDEVTAQFAKDTKLIIGCRSGGRSLSATRALLIAGFTNVIDQRAGWDGSRDRAGEITEPGWSRVGLPSEP